MLRRVLVTLLVGLMTAPLAAEPRAPGDPDCTCRAKGGRRLQIGDTLCLDTADGPRIAQCIKNQNLTFWHFSSEGCALSSLRIDHASRL